MSFIKDIDGIDSAESVKTQENAEDSRRMIEARQIVKEVLDFGINQNQLFQIMGLLAMEIENRDTMLKLVLLVKQCQEEHHIYKLGM